ncbi:DUF6174 domain-containing protein [Streptomyces sp. NPDC057877]|uniref:DUF6174 domain-containing protein n=1 Tax=Streptomyces sp. NPDC057877 TaxID=3346269 RepID=UPI003692DFCF
MNTVMSTAMSTVMNTAMSTMNSVRTAIVSVLLATALLACGGDGDREVGGTTTWAEPASYRYTLTSSTGERPLIGTFRISVRGGEVAEAEGLDDSGRRVVGQTPHHVPTIGRLLAEVEQARREGADEAEVAYAAKGHPARITLDWDRDAIDDEALYVISDYAPGPATRD